MSSRRTFLKGCAAMVGAGFAFASELTKQGNGPALFGAEFLDAESAETGSPLTPWEPGMMEIHHIYTGHGESVFHIFPDGTSLLIDAGQLERIGYELKSVTLPDESRGPGENIARYIQRVNPHGSEVDYMMISHFHSDHMGTCRVHRGKTEGRGEDYFLSGMSQVGEWIRFKKGFDRGFPDYSRPFPVTDPDVENFRRFTRWKMKTDGLAMEPFEVGRLGQIALLSDPETYRGTFRVRNLCGNGLVWTGREGENDTSFYDLAKEKGSASENPLSLGLRIDYGPFRCYTSGDFNESFTGLDGRERNLEEMVAPACGRVDVCKSNHHSYIGSMQAGFLRVLRPQVFVTDVWDLLHIQPSTMERMTDRNIYPGGRIVCPTCFPLMKKQEFDGAPWRSGVAEDCGHVVIRVYEGGTRFRVYYLTAHDESMRVKAVYGPFEASPKDGTA